MTALTNPPGAPRFRVDFRTGNDVAWVILRGEADISTLGRLNAALESEELDGARSIHLHLRELDFADVVTVRRLTDFAKRAQQTGHAVTTCGASSTFRMIARMFEARDDLGLL